MSMCTCKMNWFEKLLWNFCIITFYPCNECVQIGVKKIKSEIKKYGRPLFHWEKDESNT